MNMQIRGFGVLVAASLAAGGLWAPAAYGQSTLRVVQQADVKFLDPIWTTAYVSRNAGYLNWDTLFGMDSKLSPKPQMLEKYDVSADKKTYTFTLRDGLEWHDGKPVTSEDCIASIKRWGARDVMGQKLLEFVAEMKEVDAKTFQLVLKEPYGLVIDSLGKPSSNVPFMMPKRIAETNPMEQIKEYVGSGPFVFKADEWKPGEKVVYVKNPKYKPRSEPADSLSGGKVAKVDRVELISMPDVQTQVNAIANGEIDLIEQPPHDLLPMLEKEKDVALFDWNPLGHQFIARFNHLHKPFNDPKIRLAAMYSLSQEEYLKATIGNPKYYKVCPSVYVCGTPLAAETPGGLLIKPDFEKSKALLKEAGYDGTPVVLMQSTDLAVLTNTAPVAKSLLERGGFKVEMITMDWQTLISRRSKQTAPSDGGWNMFHTFSVAADVLNPVATSYQNGNGVKGWFGWPTDPEIEKLRDSFARETDAAKQKAIAAAVQERLLTQGMYGYMGQWYVPGAHRKVVKGWLAAPALVLWNIEKTGK